MYFIYIILYYCKRQTCYLRENNKLEKLIYSWLYRKKRMLLALLFVFLFRFFLLLFGSLLSSAHYSQRSFESNGVCYFLRLNYLNKADENLTTAILINVE